MQRLTIKVFIPYLIVCISALFSSVSAQQSFLQWKDSARFPLKILEFEKMFYRKVTEGRQFLLINNKNNKFLYVSQSALGIYFFSSGTVSKFNNSDSIFLLKSFNKVSTEDAARIKSNSKFYKFKYFNGKDSLSYIRLYLDN